MSDITRHYRDR